MSSPPTLTRKKSAITIVLFVLLFVISSVLLAYLLRETDWSLIKRINPYDLLLIFALTVLGTIIYVTLIVILVRGSGYSTSFKTAYLVLTASLTANYVTPVKVGIPLRIYLYNQIMNIPVNVGTALVAVEALAGILIPALIACIGILFIFPSLGVLAPIALAITLLAFLIIFLRMPTERVITIVENLPFSRLNIRILQFAGRVQFAIKFIPISTIIIVIILDIVMLIIQAARLHLVLNIFIVSPSVFLLLFALTISVTIGNLSMIPMGLGVRDASFSFLLTQLGVPTEIALSASIIQRLFSPGWPLFLGVISTYILGVGKFIESKSGESTLGTQPIDNS